MPRRVLGEAGFAAASVTGYRTKGGYILTSDPVDPCFGYDLRYPVLLDEIGPVGESDSKLLNSQNAISAVQNLERPRVFDSVPGCVLSLKNRQLRGCAYIRLY